MYVAEVSTNISLGLLTKYHSYVIFPGPLGITYKSGITPPTHKLSFCGGVFTSGAGFTMRVHVSVFTLQSIDVGSCDTTQKYWNVPTVSLAGV